MATKLVYKTDTGEIKAIVSADQDIDAVMSNWDNAAWIETDLPFKFEHITKMRVDPITKQLTKK